MRNRIIFILALFLVLFQACKAIKPEVPPNNAEDRGHEMPNETIYEFTKGNLSHTEAMGLKMRAYLGDGFVADVKNGSEANSPEAEVQKISFKYNEAGELKSQGKLIMQADCWYRLRISFINKAGENINYQYIKDEEARNLHQFFFRSFLWEDDKNNVNKMYKTMLTGEDRVFDCRYGDKFDDGKLIDPPIGFTVYLRLNSQKAKALGLKRIVLNPILVHSMASSKLRYDKTAKEFLPYPFDNPGVEILSVTDIDHRFEVDFKF